MTPVMLERGTMEILYTVYIRSLGGGRPYGGGVVFTF